MSILTTHLTHGPTGCRTPVHTPAPRSAARPQGPEAEPASGRREREAPTEPAGLTAEHPGAPLRQLQ